MPAADDVGDRARPAFVFSATSIGDLVLATLALDIISRRADPLPIVVGAAGAPALLAADERVAGVRVVRSSRALVWRAQTLRHVLAARRAGARLVNLEVYPPRWRFVRRATRALGLDALALDLPAYRDDNARSARGEATLLPHRAHHYARALGHDGDPPPLRLAVGAAGEAAAASHLRQAAQAGGGPPVDLARSPLIVVHAGSTERARRPPPALVAHMIEGLAHGRRPLFAFVGSADERPETARIVSALPHGVAVADLCGRLPLEALPAALRAARLFVGGDSGPLKIAEAVGARSVSFWATNATRPAFAGARGAGHLALPFDATPEAALRAARTLLEG